MSDLRKEGLLLLAATSRGATERLAADCGIEPSMILDRYELAADPSAFRRACQGPDVRHVVVHSVDWRRETMPQLYTAALAAARGTDRWLLDERAGTIRRLSPAWTWLSAARAPLEVLAAVARGVAGAARFLGGAEAELQPRIQNGDVDRILAIWGGDVDATVGGSVTHLSGILAGFRRAGVVVGLVTTAPPPPQIAAAVDAFEVADPLPPGARATPELAALSFDRRIVAAAERLAGKLGAPTAIYQRHAPFRAAGVALAERWDVPLVLEWNGSVTWSFANWSHSAKPLARSTKRLMAAVERRVASSASLITAVSELARDKALVEGADPARAITVPNAVDVEEVDAALHAAHTEPQTQPLVGWIGSFGDWHGAEVLIRAMPRMPDDARVLMIGDGRERGRCQRLADELGVADRVIWQGKTPHDRALRLLRDCDVLASPHVELAGGEPFFGSPTKIFEYMALSRPIVASRLGQIGEVLEHNRTALLVTPGDERELAEATSVLLEDRMQGERLAAAARLEVESAHTWDHRATAILTRIGAR
jgi:glycosyltransferase involved in cell wall biosynthesis